MLQPGRVEALSSGQNSLVKTGVGLGSERGKGLQRCYLRASRWVQTWEKTLSTEPSALTCGETSGEQDMLGGAGRTPQRPAPPAEARPASLTRPQWTAAPHQTSGEAKAQAKAHGWPKVTAI